MSQSRKEILHVRDGCLTLRLWPTSRGAIIGVIRQEVMVEDRFRTEEVPVLVPVPQATNEILEFASEKTPVIDLVEASIGLPSELGEPVATDEGRMLPLGVRSYRGEDRPVRAFLNSFVPAGERIYASEPPVHAQKEGVLA